MWAMNRMNEWQIESKKVKAKEKKNSFSAKDKLKHVKKRTQPTIAQKKILSYQWILCFFFHVHFAYTTISIQWYVWYYAKRDTEINKLQSNNPTNPNVKIKTKQQNNDNNNW